MNATVTGGPDEFPKVADLAQGVYSQYSPLVTMGSCGVKVFGHGLWYVHDLLVLSDNCSLVCIKRVISELSYYKFYLFDIICKLYLCVLYLS